MIEIYKRIYSSERVRDERKELLKRKDVHKLLVMTFM
jgi:hypothetical protein